MDKFKAMQTFLCIADAGSLTAAAREMGSSLPAVVRSLAAYETELGVRLFHRTTRRISLTEEGREHLERCRHVMAAVEDAESSLRAGATLPQGHLRITAPVLFGQMYVAPVVTRFVEAHPGLRCTTLLLDRNVNLLEEGLDLAVRIGRLDDSSLVAQGLGHIRRVVVGSPAYLRKHGTPVHPRELRSHNCIRNAISARSTWGDFQERQRTFQVPVAGNLEFNHVWPAVQACASGAGLGMFFSYQVAQLVEQDVLRTVLEPFELPAVPISIVYPHARLLPSRTRAFIDYAKAEITQFRVPAVV